MSNVRLILGDCLEVMAGMDANSVHSVVTDPPYGLSFMGKDWDHGVPGVPFWEAALRVAKPGAILLAFGGDRTHHRLMVAIEDAGWEIRTCLYWVFGSGFPKGKRVDEHASRLYQAGDLCQCAASTHRNGHTYHVQQILDRICTAATWDATEHDLESSVRYGLHKSLGCQDDCHPVSHSCDESLRQVAMHVLASVQPQEYAQEHSRFDVRADGLGAESLHSLFRVLCSDLPSMLDYLHPSFLPHVERLLRAYEDADYPEADLRKLLSSMAGALDVSTLMLADISAYRTPHIYSLVSCLPLPILRMLCDKNYDTIIPQMEICGNCNGMINKWSGWNVALKPAAEIIVMARKPLDGTIAQNVLKHGVGGLNIDGCRIPSEQDRPTGLKKNGARSQRVGNDGWDRPWKHDERAERIVGNGASTTIQGRWPSNLLLDESAAAILDQMSGERPTGGCNGIKKERISFGENGTFAERARDTGYARAPSTGGASRYFLRVASEEPDEPLRMYYSGKASKSDRNSDGAVNNIHPTCKPRKLMQWLSRLACPPGGTILDPFLGSGTTGVAAVLEGFDFIGIELDAEYLELAKRRIEHAQSQARMQLPLLEIA